MQEKKSYKADLERRRPLLFAIALAVVTLLFVIILAIPYKSISHYVQRLLDEPPTDLDFQLRKEDDMIAAAPPQHEKPEKEKVILHKVDTPPEEQPELLEEFIPDTPHDLEEEVEKKEDLINMSKDDEEALRKIEELPQYPGGMVEFVKWLTAQLHYPTGALRQNKTGRVMLSFFVETDGTLTNLRVEKSSGNKQLDGEAMRVAQLMPQWIPGKSQGRTVRYKVAIPIVFEI